jgi:cysteine desulfurase/selenocysteine lyase
MLSRCEDQSSLPGWNTTLILCLGSSCAARRGQDRVAPVDDDGQILLDEYQKLLGSRTKLVAFSQVSNALGTVTPARQVIEMAHRVGARVLVDGAQSVSHMRVDMQQLDCDWFVFSGHKVFGPTGIGALFGKSDLLNSSPVAGRRQHDPERHLRKDGIP